MNTTATCKRLGAALLAGGLMATSAQAAIFTENFNSYAGNQNNTQGDTGLNVAHSGNVAGWSTSGAGTMHAVDLGGSDWAIMLWTDNVITQSAGIAANDNGTSYEVKFDYGTAVYAGTHMSQKTLAGDKILVEVLRSDTTVLASAEYTPGEWTNPANVNLSAGLSGTLAYVGDGTGDVKLRIGPAAGTFGENRFAGEIDNISVDVVPEPSSLALLGLGGLLIARRRRD